MSDTTTSPAGGDTPVDATLQPEVDEFEDLGAAGPGEDDEGEELEPIEGSATQEDDDIELDVDGVKFKVPKAAQSAFLKNADYTQKTQALAQERAQVEAERKAIADAKAEADRRAEVQRESIKDHAALLNLDAQLEEFGKVDWDRVDADDLANGTNNANRWMRQWQLLKDQRQELAAKVDGAERQRLQQDSEAAETEKREAAKLRAEGAAVLAREIPNWGPDLAGKLVEFGQTVGFTYQELDQVNDPRLIKLLHRVYQADLKDKQASKTQAVIKAQATQPAATVPAASAPATRDLGAARSTDEWMRRREAQLAKKRSGGG